MLKSLLVTVEAKDGETSAAIGPIVATMDGNNVIAIIQGWDGMAWVDATTGKLTPLLKVKRQEGGWVWLGGLTLDVPELGGAKALLCELFIDGKSAGYMWPDENQPTGRAAVAIAVSISR